MHEVLGEGSEFDGGERIKPFLFYGSGKSTKAILKQPIDFSYDVHGVSHTTGERMSEQTG